MQNRFRSWQFGTFAPPDCVIKEVRSSNFRYICHVSRHMYVYIGLISVPICAEDLTILEFHRLSYGFKD